MPYFVLWVCILIALLIVRIAIGRVRPVQKLEVSMATTLGCREIYAEAYDWAHFDQQMMYVIASGIGRSRKGKIAADVAVETFVRYFESVGASENPPYFFEWAFHGANAAILRHIVDSTAGASVLSAIVKDGRLYHASAGNCRLSVFRNGNLVPLSEGQTIDVLAKKAFKQGQISRLDALSALKEKRVYSYVGHDGFKGMEMFDVPVILKKGDVIVIMSSGVYEFCTSKQIEDILKGRKGRRHKAEAIIKLLEQTNAPDQSNATVILVRVNKI